MQYHLVFFLLQIVTLLSLTIMIYKLKEKRITTVKLKTKVQTYNYKHIANSYRSRFCSVKEDSPSSLQIKRH